MHQSDCLLVPIDLRPARFDLAVVPGQQTLSTPLVVYRQHSRPGVRCRLEPVPPPNAGCKGRIRRPPCPLLRGYTERKPGTSRVARGLEATVTQLPYSDPGPREQHLLQLSFPHTLVGDAHATLDEVAFHDIGIFEQNRSTPNHNGDLRSVLIYVYQFGLE